MRPRGAPVADQLDGALHVAVRVPLGVVGRRHVGDADVVVSASGRMSSSQPASTWDPMSRSRSLIARQASRGRRRGPASPRPRRRSGARARRPGRARRSRRRPGRRDELAGRVDVGPVGVRRGGWRRPCADAITCAGNGCSSSGCASKCWVHSLRTTRHGLAGVGAGMTVPSSAGGEQRLLVAVDGARLGRGDEAGADPHAVGAERERGGEAAAVEEPAGGDDGDLVADRVDDLRHERHRRDRAGVPAGLGALGDDEVAPAGDRADRRGAPCRTSSRRGRWRRAARRPRRGARRARRRTCGRRRRSRRRARPRPARAARSAGRRRTAWRSARGPPPSRSASSPGASSRRRACRCRRPR